MEWKEKFTQKTIDEGFDCFYEDKVHDINLNRKIKKVQDYMSNSPRQRPRIITAMVEDDDIDNEVVILHMDETILSVVCTCPDFHLSNDSFLFLDDKIADENYCKHIAATLYALDEILCETLANLRYNPLSSVDEIVNEIKTSASLKLRSGFITKSEYDEIIEKLMQSQVDISIDYLESQKRVLNNILEGNIEKSFDDIPYKGEAPLNIILLKYIKEVILPLNGRFKYEYSRELLYLIYEKIAIREDANECFDIKNILRNCYMPMHEVIAYLEDEKEEMFNHFMKIIENNYNRDTAYEILFICDLNYTSNNKHYKLRLLDVINQIIEKEDDIDERVFKLKRELMSRLTYPKKDILLEMFDHEKYDKIEEIRDEYSIKEDNYYTIIQVLERSFKKLSDATLLEKNSKELKNDIDLLENTLLLIYLYTLTHNKKKCIEKIKILLFDFEVCDIKYISQLKEVCTKKQWEKELRNMIKYYQSKKNYDFINEIYIYADRYEDLYKNIIDNCQVETLEEYRSYYQEEHNDDILDIYKEVILEKQQTARNRLAYNTIIGYLDTMLTYDNSEEIVHELVDTLKNNKKNKGKKVFLEELRKFEYTLKN